MTFTKALTRQLASWMPWVFGIWAATVLVFASIEVNATRVQRSKVDALESKSFDDFMVYYEIKPAVPVVPHGAQARFISDSEVIKGGFWIEWREKIECDYTPSNGVDTYEFYAAAEVTETTHDRPVPRVTEEPLLGWPVRSVSTSKIIEYPMIDADCRLVSRMTQHHPHGHRKLLVKRSSPVQVRKSDQ